MSFARVRALVVVGVLAVGFALVFVVVALVRDTQGDAVARLRLPRRLAAGRPHSCRDAEGGQDQCLQRDRQARPRRRGRRATSATASSRCRRRATTRRRVDDVAVLRYGPKAVGSAHLLQAYFLNEADAGVRPEAHRRHRRRGDRRQLQAARHDHRGQPGAGRARRARSCRRSRATAPKVNGRSCRRSLTGRRRRPARPAGRAAAPKSAGGAADDHVRPRGGARPARRPAGPPPSATRPPAAWSQALSPFS